MSESCTEPAEVRYPGGRLQARPGFELRVDDTIIGAYFDQGRITIPVYTPISDLSVEEARALIAVLTKTVEAAEKAQNEKES